MKNNRITGTAALKLGNNIDTDQIYPGRFLELVDADEIGKHCLAGIDEKIAVKFPKGGIVVAGRNFGCGSSREHAAIALIHMGASAVIAESFARIFYRNAINLALPVIICKGISEKVQENDRISLDIENGDIWIENKNIHLPAEPLGEMPLKILEAGGIKQLFRQEMNKYKNSYEGGLL